MSVAFGFKLNPSVTSLMITVRDAQVSPGILLPFRMSDCSTSTLCNEQVKGGDSPYMRTLGHENRIENTQWNALD